MSPIEIAWLSFGLLLALLLLGVPVAATMAIVGFIGYALIQGWDPAFGIASIGAYSRVASYSLTVIPLFIIMGSFMETGGLITDVFDTAKKWIGKWPGGLLQATIVFGAVFGGPCGSGPAGTATVARICIPELLKNKVDRALAFGTVAAVGPLSAMIPPSNLIIIYCIIADAPMGKMLMGGFIPGFFAAAVFMIQIAIMTLRNRSLAPRYEENATWKERLVSLKSTWAIMLIMVITMGGIYTGIFTPTESGGVGAFSAFVMALMMRRLSWDKCWQIAIDTTRTVSMLFITLAGASILGYLITITRLPVQFSEFIAALDANRWVIFAAVVVMYLFLGMILDSVTQMIITVPIILPTILSLGFDPIWYGIIIIHLMELGAITPPFALSIFVLQGLFPEVPIKVLYKGILPYIVSELFILLCFVLIPVLITWLPSMMK